MDKENIDASLGLEFSLTLFEQYRKNGLLYAEVHHMPGIRGRCRAFLYLVEGKVIQCYIEDKQGIRHRTNKGILTRVDNERGPFEWTLVQNPSPPSLPSPHPETAIPLYSAQNTPIPKVVSPLNLEWLEGWSYQQKLLLSVVYDLIDGVTNIEGIKSKAPLPAEVTEEALRVLLTMKFIIILV
ncbi:hypothetical protein [Dictyobacter arantiisoli]|uniref:Uncharacterized protein n=1 Tax=Dictyobacter arantiisoli TaxID=2014874 RepID=A0A5A5TEW7_9CHLR|nr:hypothetical protein [Dictyobacter arantiisoli]GCF09454.1 hypothetical protein KDI_30180 [Dictyobacter arantiisoli]